LPTHWPSTAIIDNESVKVGYSVYQYQIRSFTTHEIIYDAFFRKPNDDKSVSVPPEIHEKEKENTIVFPIQQNSPQQFRAQFRKPAYKSPAVFSVTPDEQYDVYFLHAYRNPQEPRVQIGVAGIPTLHISAIMNRLFRNIRENDNIDYAEESEDEADFEEAVYTFKDRVLLMECIFDFKTKKWVPCRVVSSKTRLTPIYNL